jgi:hypothetical protein
MGERASHVFRFRNIGQAELEIRKVGTSCSSCTTATLSSERLNPQAVGELRVDFRETKEAGQLLRTIEVYTNDPSNPIETLTITALVVESYKVSPSRLYFDANGTKELDFSSIASLNLQITNVEASSEYLSAIVGDHQRVDDRIVSRMKVSLSAPASMNRAREYITIHTNSDIVSDIKIPIRIRMGQSISIQPEKLFFGAISSGKQVTRRAVISIPDGSSTRIERIECKSQAVSAECVKEQNRHLVVVKLNPHAPLGRFQDIIQVHTNDPDIPVLELTAYGAVLPVRKTQ